MLINGSAPPSPRRPLIALFAMLVLAACTHAPPPAPCAGWSPIRLTAQEFYSLSDESQRQVLAHQTHGANVCGWPP
jgi:hypothetical protein